MLDIICYTFIGLVVAVFLFYLGLAANDWFAETEESDTEEITRMFRQQELLLARDLLAEIYGRDPTVQELWDFSCPPNLMEME
jgi:hypothetical protein